MSSDTPGQLAESKALSLLGEAERAGGLEGKGGWGKYRRAQWWVARCICQCRYSSSHRTFTIRFERISYRHLTQAHRHLRTFLIRTIGAAAYVPSMAVHSDFTNIRAGHSYIDCHADQRWHMHSNLECTGCPTRVLAKSPSRTCFCVNAPPHLLPHPAVRSLPSHSSRPSSSW
jgi:hypothetical protein